jgi:hypothetical protein
MSDYIPDRWVVVKITTKKERLYKVFASWVGGFASADSWKLNSGITRATLVDDTWEFDGYSGSVYTCHKNKYGTSVFGDSILQNLINRSNTTDFKMEVLPKNTNWAILDYDQLQQFIANGAQND